MDSPFLAYFVAGFFLGAAILLFDRTRHLVIYGTSARSVFWVLGCIAVFFAAGSLSNSAHLKSEPQWFQPPPVFKPDLAIDKKERVVGGYAQLTFVETGKLIEYLRANGERTTYLPSQADIVSRASKLAATTARQKEAELLLLVARVWWFAWIPVLLLGYFSARTEYSNLLRFHNFNRQRNKFKSFGEVEGFVGLLMTACEQSDTYNTLETILSQSDESRQSMLRKLISVMRDKGAPKELTDAFVCLMDNDVAEKVYVYIHKCRRQPAVKLAA